MATTRDHLPPQGVVDDHVTRTGTSDLPKRVLPRTDVPDYLVGTPLQEQTRHADSFHTNQPQAMQAGDRADFRRPSLADNLALIARNLARGAGSWFAMPWRKDDSAEARVPAGDGTPWDLL